MGAEGQDCKTKINAGSHTVPGTLNFSAIEVTHPTVTACYNDYSTGAAGGLLGGATEKTPSVTYCDYWLSEYERNKEQQTRQEGLDATALIIAAVASALYLVFLNKYKDAQDARDEVANKLVQIMCDLHDHWLTISKPQIESIYDDIAGQVPPSADCEANVEQVSEWVFGLTTSEQRMATVLTKCEPANECDNSLVGFATEAIAMAARECTDYQDRKGFEFRAQQALNLNAAHRNMFTNQSVATTALATSAGMTETLMSQYAATLNSLAGLAGGSFQAGISGGNG